MATKTVDITVATDTLAYLNGLLDAGMLSGARGKKQVNPKVKPLAEAMYHVLSGGKVQVEVMKPGNAARVRKLNRLQTAHLAAVNSIEGIKEGRLRMCI